MIETEGDRLAILMDHDALVLDDGTRVPCMYEETPAEVLESSGYLPQVTLTRGTVEGGTVGEGTPVVEVLRQDGTRRGAGRVRSLQPTGGGFYVGALETLDA